MELTSYSNPHGIIYITKRFVSWS